MFHNETLYLQGCKEEVSTKGQQSRLCRKTDPWNILKYKLDRGFTFIFSYFTTHILLDLTIKLTACFGYRIFITFLWSAFKTHSVIDASAVGKLGFSVAWKGATFSKWAVKVCYLSERQNYLAAVSKLMLTALITSLESVESIQLTKHSMRFSWRPISRQGCDPSLCHFASFIR